MRTRIDEHAYGDKNTGIWRENIIAHNTYLKIVAYPE